MKRFTYVIQDENGIHARPAGLLVKEAQRFSSDITLQVKEKSASLKKLFAIMGLGVKKGDIVTVTADGADEDDAATALEDFLKNHF